MVLLDTGLRAEDTLNVQSSGIDNSVIRWPTGKTGADAVIPLHSKLLAELKRVMDVLYLIQSVKRVRITLASSLNHGLHREFKRLGLTSPPLVHGLRKNRVMKRLEAGCEIGEDHALTG